MRVCSLEYCSWLGCVINSHSPRASSSLEALVALRCQLDPVWQPIAGTFDWHWVVTEPCCFRDTDAHVALSGTTGQDPTMVQGGITGCSHIRLFLTTLRSPVLRSSLCLHLSGSSLHHLILLAVPRVSEHLGHVWMAVSHSSIMSLSRAHLEHGLIP